VVHRFRFHIKPHHGGFAVFNDEALWGIFPYEAVAKWARNHWLAQLARGKIPIPSPPAQALKDAIVAAEEAAAMNARLAALEERLTANPLARPGWGATSLPNTLAGRVAAVLRQNYAADLPRKEIERRLRVGEDQFRFPEPFDLGPFGLSTLKTALRLARE
jgi:hypothetical protein